MGLFGQTTSNPMLAFTFKDAADASVVRQR